MKHRKTQNIPVEQFTGFRFNSHECHNPACDILEGFIDKDSLLTYGIYVGGPHQGQEFCEYYHGSNYRAGSKAKSYSRHYVAPRIPTAYVSMWEELREMYNKIEK